MTPPFKAAAAEALGSFLLFAAVVGSGIMAVRLADGNDAIALLANSIATGASLFVLVTMLGPLSGAHFNPAVSAVMWLEGELPARRFAPFLLAQLGGGVAGVIAAHLMFDLPPVTLSHHVRTGAGQWLGEGLATFGLLLTILMTRRSHPAHVPASVALYIVAAYWFTSTTSFANPAITVARSLTGSFAGIAPADVPAFIAAQFAGAALALPFARWLLGTHSPGCAALKGEQQGVPTG